MITKWSLRVGEYSDNWPAPCTHKCTVTRGLIYKTVCGVHTKSLGICKKKNKFTNLYNSAWMLAWKIFLFKKESTWCVLQMCACGKASYPVHYTNTIYHKRSTQNPYKTDIITDKQGVWYAHPKNYLGCWFKKQTSSKNLSLLECYSVKHLWKLLIQCVDRLLI